MIRILCFGDSNTYGYKPDKSGRFDENVRWTGIIQERLGEGYRVIEEGLCGRTTIFDDELRIGRRGVDLVGTLVETHNPIDIFIVMLGTNDCKARYKATAGIIAKGVEQVVEQAKLKASKTMKILVISPITLGRGVGEDGYDVEFDEKSELVSYKLAEKYQKMALDNNYYFLDASEYAEPSVEDREHLDETGHARLADAIYNKLSEILEEDNEYKRIAG